MWSPQSASATTLLRSHTFNRRDEWLPLSRREAIAAAIAASAHEIQQQALERAAAFDREFAAANSRGHARTVDLARYPGEAQTAALGPEPFYQIVDGKRLGVARAEMPTTVRATRRLRELGADLVGRLATIFMAGGALTPQETEALLEQSARIAKR